MHHNRQLIKVYFWKKKSKSEKELQCTQSNLNNFLNKRHDRLKSTNIFRATYPHHNITGHHNQGKNRHEIRNMREDFQFLITLPERATYIIWHSITRKTDRISENIKHYQRLEVGNWSFSP